MALTLLHVKLNCCLQQKLAQNLKFSAWCGLPRTFKFVPGMNEQLKILSTNRFELVVLRGSEALFVVEAPMELRFREFSFELLNSIRNE